MGRKTHLKWSWPSDWSSSRQELPKFFLKEGRGGGGDGTGQDSVLFADIIYKIFISFQT